MIGYLSSARPLRRRRTQAEGLEQLAHRHLTYKTSRSREMDLPGLPPAQAGAGSIDEPAHTNTPGVETRSATRMWPTCSPPRSTSTDRSTCSASGSLKDHGGRADRSDGARDVPGSRCCEGRPAVVLDSTSLPAIADRAPPAGKVYPPTPRARRAQPLLPRRAPPRHCTRSRSVQVARDMEAERLELQRIVIHAIASQTRASPMGGGCERLLALVTPQPVMAAWPRAITPGAPLQHLGADLDVLIRPPARAPRRRSAKPDRGVPPASARCSAPRS